MHRLKIILQTSLLCQLMTIYSMNGVIFCDNNHNPLIQYNADKSASLFNNRQVWELIADGDKFETVFQTPRYIVLVGECENGRSILVHCENKKIRRIDGSILQVSTDGSIVLVVKKFTPLDSTVDYLWTSIINPEQEPNTFPPLVSCAARIRYTHEADERCDFFEIKSGKSREQYEFCGPLTFKTSLCTYNGPQAIDCFRIDIVCDGKRTIFLYDAHTGQLLEESNPERSPSSLPN